jgi:enoyl-CoA hydratase
MQRMITREGRGDVAVLQIDRAERRNALDIEHCDGLTAAVEDSVAGGARAIVITGSGSSFCAGADFGEVHEPLYRDSLYRMLRATREAAVPVIAAVNGPAIGAGTQLAIACDLRIAAETAAFGVPTAAIGLAVDPWTIRRLAALAGTGAASAIVLGLEKVDARDAHRAGLVNRIGDLDAALGWAADIAALAPLTLTYSKRVLQAFGTDASPEGLEEAFARCWASDDLKEGERARAEKRPPRFRGA